MENENNPASAQPGAPLPSDPFAPVPGLRYATRRRGVSVFFSRRGTFRVYASGAAVRAWPWDGSAWPCADLSAPHAFTFQGDGDLCDIETRQRDAEGNENERAQAALADDCRALALDIRAAFASGDLMKPADVRAILWQPGTLDAFTFVLKTAKGEANPGNVLFLGTCDSGRGFSQIGEASRAWVRESRRARVGWETIPDALRRHVRARLNFGRTHRERGDTLPDVLGAEAGEHGDAGE